MANTDEGRMTIYYIPDNFVGESRILGGRIRVRYLIDAIMLAAVLFIFVGYPLVFIAMRNSEIPYRAAAAVISVAPGIVLGMVGFNGDPFSIFLGNLFRWQKTKEVRLYNETPRRLGTDPVKAVYESRKNMDKIVSMVEGYQQGRIDKKNAKQYVEGETFNFQYDPSIDGFLDDSGDYSDDEMTSGSAWPEADIEIATGGDLSDLESLLNSEWYTDLTAHEVASESENEADKEILRGDE